MKNKNQINNYSMGVRAKEAEVFVLTHQKIHHCYYFKGLPETQAFAEFVKSSGAAPRLKPPTRQTPAEICSTRAAEPE